MAKGPAWRVVGVMGERSYAPFAYTVGLSTAFDHPEVVIFGLNDDLDFMGTLLNDIGARVEKGERFAHGDKKRDLLPGYTCPIARFPKAAYDEHLGQAQKQLGNDFDVVQCIWPDPKKRLPWDPKVMPPVLGRQPVFLRPDAGPRDPVWPFAAPHSLRVITTIQVVTGKEPVRFVGRFDDGEYQFVCETTDDEDDIVVATLGWMVDHDRALARAAKLEAGEGLKRRDAGGRWTKLEGWDEG